MSKTAKTDVIEFPAFDTSKATDQLRTFAEKGMETTKEAYERLRSNAEELQKQVEATFEGTRSSMNELSLKTVGAMRTNAEAGFSHLEALIGAKSLSEVLELQTAFMRKTFEQAVEQGKELQGSMTKLTTELSKPAKSVFEQAANKVKAA